MYKAGVYIQMSKKEIRYNLRITPEELARWRAFAVAANISLSAWIRERCNMEGTWKSVKEFFPKPAPMGCSTRKPCKHGLLFCKKCAP